jgi:hypothetical protein
VQGFFEVFKRLWTLLQNDRCDMRSFLEKVGDRKWEELEEVEFGPCFVCV